MALLPPSENDRNISLLVPKAKDPYLVEFYQDTKKEGEGVNAFILRNLMRLASQYQLQKQYRSLETVKNNKHVQDMETVINELSFLEE